jgi:thymidylate kinase
MQLRRVAKCLAGRHHQVAMIGEFSATPFGDFLKGVVERERFFRLSYPKRTPRAETLALLADLALKIEGTINGQLQAGVTVLSDRGVISLIAYQACRLDALYGGRSGCWVDDVVEAAVAGLRVPDLHVILEAPFHVIQERLAIRGERPLTEQQLRFMDNVKREMRRIAEDRAFKSVIVDSHKEPSDLTAEITELVLRKAPL